MTSLEQIVDEKLGSSGRINPPAPDRLGERSIRHELAREPSSQVVERQLEEHFVQPFAFVAIELVLFPERAAVI